MEIKLGVKIGKIHFKNPVLVASGTFGYAKEFEKIIDLKKLGGIVTKTITLKERLGNPPPRIVETPSGMLNAIGLQNVGVAHFIEDKLPFLSGLRVPIIVSIMGYTVQELIACVKVLEKAKGIDGYEINLSCPNVSYSSQTSKTSACKMFAHDALLIEAAISAIRKNTKKTLIAKLGPDVSDIGHMARAAERSGADAVSLINTFMAMVIDIDSRKPVLANKTGGLSGPCIRPIAVRLVWEAAQAVRIPVIGMGGIMNTQDAIEFLIAGASAVQIGTANFINPYASVEIIEGIEKFMRSKKINNIQSIIGSIYAKVNRYETQRATDSSA